MSDVLDDITEPLGEEYIYRPQTEVKKPRFVKELTLEEEAKKYKTADEFIESQIEIKETNDYGQKVDNLGDFKKELEIILSDEILNGNKTGNRTGIEAVFGGTDIKGKAQRAFQNISYILTESPDLIRLIPEEHLPLTIEFLRQNNEPIVSIVEDILENKKPNLN